MSAAVYASCAWCCSGIELPPAMVLVFVVVVGVLALLVIAGDGARCRSRSRASTIRIDRCPPLKANVLVKAEGAEQIRAMARAMAPELDRMAQAAELLMQRDPVLELGRVLAVLLLELHDLQVRTGQDSGGPVTDHERIARHEVEILRACLVGMRRYEGAALDSAWASKLLDEHGMPHDDNLRRWRWVPTARRPAA